MNWESTETFAKHRIGQCVLDYRDGSILQGVQWFQNLPYNKIVHSYYDFVLKNYGSTIVKFDGYKSKTFTDDCTHHRRKRKSKKSLKQIVFS